VVTCMNFDLFARTFIPSISERGWWDWKGITAGLRTRVTY
jgi:hypothetical protein